jgi:transposase
MVGGIENRGESMPKTRKSHPPSLKAKVAVEAIKAHKTAAQIAQMFGVHPTQVGGWKKQALAGLPDIFGNGREQMRQQADADKDELYKQIGQLKVELDFSQKKSWPHRLKTNVHGSIPSIRASASNSNANCWECRAQPTTISRFRRARRICVCSASSISCT